MLANFGHYVGCHLFVIESYPGSSKLLVPAQGA